MRRKFYTVLERGEKSLRIVPENTQMVALHAGGTRPPFFMIDSYPYFIDVVKLLGPEQPVISLIGHEDMLSAGHYSIEDEAAQHVQTVLRYQPRGPYVFGGCSASGIVAYEMVQQMNTLGHQVSTVVLFDVPNPHYMIEYSAVWTSLNSYRDDLRRLDARQIPLWVALKLRWFIVKTVSRLQNHLLRTNGTPERLDPEEMRSEAARSYRPAPYAGNVLLFRRCRGELSTPYLKLMVACQLRHCEQYLDAMFGWGEVVSGNLEICYLSGLDHLEIFKSEIDRATVKLKLCERLDRISARPSSFQGFQELQQRA
jgi:thioesterase domain-containing protein